MATDCTSNKEQCSLHLSLLSRARLPLTRQPFDLRRVLHEAARITWPVAQAQGLRFVLQVAPIVPQRAVGDQMRLFQVLLRLIPDVDNPRTCCIHIWSTTRP